MRHIKYECDICNNLFKIDEVRGLSFNDNGPGSFDLERDPAVNPKHICLKCIERISKYGATE